MNYIDNLITRHKELEFLRENICKTVEAIKNAYYNGGKILVCGNGGSCSDSDHIVGELLKGFLSKRKLTEEQKKQILDKNYNNGQYIADSLQQGISAYSLNAQGAIVSAVINDIGSDMMFAQQVYGMAEKNDLVIGISTSGNAENVCNALKVARVKGATTLGLTGNKNGKMNEFCNILIDVPSSETYIIQEYHIAIYHAFCAEAELEIFENNI